MAKTHPHLAWPTEAQLAELVAHRPQNVREAYLAVHRLVLAAVPDVGFSVDTVDAQVGYGAYQYGYNGWGMAALSPHSAWVTFFLMTGSRLPDPGGILEGSGAMRHLKLRSAEQVDSRARDLNGFLEAAVRLSRDAG